MDGLNSLGEGFWDGLTKALVPASQAATNLVTAIRGSGQMTSGQELAVMEAARQAEESRKMQQYLIYGGVAIGAIALIMYMRKR